MQQVFSTPPLFEGEDLKNHCSQVQQLRRLAKYSALIVYSVRLQLPLYYIAGAAIASILKISRFIPAMPTLGARSDDSRRLSLYWTRTPAESAIQQGARNKI